MSAITTHVLDTARGRPADGVAIILERAESGDSWTLIGRGQTDADGRLRTLMDNGASLTPGRYRLVFETRQYFNAHRQTTFYPQVIVVFEVAPGETHYHVPLLLSPFGYTTYRGS